MNLFLVGFLSGGASVLALAWAWFTERGALPKIRQRSEIEDCGQDGVCRLSPGCNRHWEERNRELVRERMKRGLSCDERQ